MTVLRREGRQSKHASWDIRPYRRAGPPVLAIVPLIIRRLRGPSLPAFLQSPFTDSFTDLVHLPRTGSLAHAGRGCSAAQRKPASSRAIATAILGAG